MNSDINFMDAYYDFIILIEIELGIELGVIKLFELELGPNAKTKLIPATPTRCSWKAALILNEF